MKRFRLLLSVVAALVAASVLGMPTQARADLELSIFNNAVPFTTVKDNQIGDGSATTGEISYTGTVGNFTVTLTSDARGVLGSASTPVMDLKVTSLTHTTSGTDTLKIEVGQDGFGSSPITIPMSISGTPTGASVVYQAGLSAAQNLFNFDQGSQTISSLNGSASLGSSNGFPHFALSQFVSFTMTGSTTITADAQLGAVAAVPEPSGLVIALASIIPVLGGLGLSRLRRVQTVA